MERSLRSPCHKGSAAPGASGRYLENRHFHVDEWRRIRISFKEVFYREVLPELRARVKRMVISHDDRYFHLADRLVRWKRMFDLR